MGVGVTAPQDYFTYFEPRQSLGGAGTGDPQEKPPDYPQTELPLSHMWPKLDSNPQRWDGKQFRVLKISVLNLSATGVALVVSNRTQMRLRCKLFKIQLIPYTSIY